MIYCFVSRFETSPFKDQATVNANWLPMSRAKTPSPRPGVCSSSTRKKKRYTLEHHANQSSEYNDIPNNYESRLNFIKHHALMDDNVPSYFHNQYPLFVKTTLSERLSVITVNPNILPVVEKEQLLELSYDVIYIGTTTGRVFKFVCNISPRTSVPQSMFEDTHKREISPKFILIESIQIFEYTVPVRNILVHHDTSQVVVQSDNEVNIQTRSV